MKYIDAKNQLADKLTRRNFTRDEWNHLLCLFNISHFSSTGCSEVMSKRTQIESGEDHSNVKTKNKSDSRALLTMPSSASEGTGREVMKVRVPGVRKLRNMTERGNPLLAVAQVTRQDTTASNSLKARIQHATQDGTMTKLGLLKSGKLMN